MVTQDVDGWRIVRNFMGGLIEGTLLGVGVGYITSPLIPTTLRCAKNAKNDLLWALLRGGDTPHDFYDTAQKMAGVVSSVCMVGLTYAYMGDTAYNFVRELNDERSISSVVNAQGVITGLKAGIFIAGNVISGGYEAMRSIQTYHNRLNTSERVGLTSKF